MEELYKKHRPSSFKGLVGQAEAVQVLTGLGKAGRVPHALMLTGPSGCGKTTIARILKKKLKCHDSDFKEINASEERGIDMVRHIKDTMTLSPMNNNGVRVYLVDECHAMTKDAQNSFLKILEDTPKHVYFMLCTTDPQKLLATIKTRCTEIKVKPVSRKEIVALVQQTAEKEEIVVNEEVAEAIYEAALLEGSNGASPRKALVILNSIVSITDEDEQLAVIAQNDIKTQAYELCKMLLNGKTQWSDVAKFLKDMDDDAEGIRYMVLGFARAVLLKGNGNMRAYSMIVAFRDNFYDSKKAGLAAACFEVVKGIAE